MGECPHLLQKRTQKGGLTRIYKGLLPRFIFPLHGKNAGIKAHLARCMEVGCFKDDLVVTCAECCFFGCLDHFRKHAKHRQHSIGICLQYGDIYCGLCGDFRYDTVLETHRLEAENEYLTRKGFPRRIDCVPKETDIQCLPERAETNVGTQAIRGLVNLGNTCYVNSIMQALAHTPCLRDHFLSDQHNRCLNDTDLCLMCVVTELFQELHRPGWLEAFIPGTLLFRLWKASMKLAGYHQQDAHEFLIILIELLHKDSRPPDSPVAQSVDCKCFIDKVFSGQMRSTLSCMKCPYRSEQIHPCVDIAVPVPPDHSSTLENCLDQYCQKELLGCSRCQTCFSMGLVKQLSFKKLPVIIVIQLSRFDDSIPPTAPNVLPERKKVTSPVDYPMRIDMTKYLSAYMDDEEAFNSANGSTPSLSNYYNLYDLHAVVQHVGSLDTGHYTCFVKRKTNWYKCDDDLIYAVNESEVLRAEAYLLFYQISTFKVP